MLIANGAAVNAIPSFGSTALRQAVAAGRVEVVRVLLEAGADPGRKGLDGVSAVDEAKKAANQNAEVIEMLTKEKSRPYVD